MSTHSQAKASPRVEFGGEQGGEVMPGPGGVVEEEGWIELDVSDLQPLEDEEEHFSLDEIPDILLDALDAEDRALEASLAPTEPLAPERCQAPRTGALSAAREVPESGGGQGE